VVKFNSFGFKKMKSWLRLGLYVMAGLLVVSVSGCSQVSDLAQLSPSKAPGVVRGANLGEEWRMDQLRVNVGAGDESQVLLRLDTGDKIDGYFYLEKGESVNFQIIGESLIYDFSTQGAEDSSKITSARFSFVATQAQGNTYTLTLSNPAAESQTKVTVFLEVIYPISGSLFAPIEREQ
jgi:hypothetical protein